MYSYLCRLRCSKRRRPSLKINLGHNWKNRVNMCTAPVLRTGLLLPENRTLRSHSTRQPGLLVPVQKELLEGSRRIDTITRIRLYLYQQSWNYPYLLLGWVLRRSILMKPMSKQHNETHKMVWTHLLLRILITILLLRRCVILRAM